MNQKERIILCGNEFYEIDIECENKKKRYGEDKKSKKESGHIKNKQTKK